MKVVVAPGALADVVEARRWWREHRRDAPDVMAMELAHALRDLPRVALARCRRSGELRARASGGCTSRACIDTSTST